MLVSESRASVYLTSTFEASDLVIDKYLNLDLEISRLLECTTLRE